MGREGDNARGSRPHEGGFAKKRINTQAARHSLHQLRKRRHIGPKYRESPPPKAAPYKILRHSQQW